MITLATTELVFHDQVGAAARQFSANPSHALMINGPSGAGKASLASFLIDQLGVPVSYRYVIAPVGGKAISIEAIRALEHFLLLKVPGQSSVKRAVIIEDADTMTIEAQNALLKNLEEPPAGTILLLTATNLLSLLTTIRSRAQLLRLITPAKPQLTDHFSQLGHTSQAINRAYSMTGGLPGLMQALLADDDHPLLQAVQTARELLQATPYERVGRIDDLIKQSRLTSDTLFILQQMADVSLQTANGAASRRWQQTLRASYQAAAALNSKGQPRLVLTNLMLNLV